MMFQAEQGWTEALEVGDEVFVEGCDHGDDFAVFAVSRLTRTLVETGGVDQWKRGPGRSQWSPYVDEGREHPRSDWRSRRIWPATDANAAVVEARRVAASQEARARVLRSALQARVSVIELAELERVAELLGVTVDEKAAGR